jgi:hypothetical protein
MKVGDLVRLRTDGTMGIITGIRETDPKEHRSDFTRAFPHEYRAKWFYTMDPNFRAVCGAGNWYFRYHLEAVNESR